MGDVPERPGMDQGGLSFQGLHQVRHDRLVQQCHQRALNAELRYGHRLAVAGRADHDAGDALAQVVRPVG